VNDVKYWGGKDGKIYEKKMRKKENQRIRESEIKTHSTIQYGDTHDVLT